MAERTHRRAPWKTKVTAELATLEWVAWYNHQRLHGSIGYIPPPLAEEIYHRTSSETESMNAVI